jgi:hypothetical protein
MVPLSQKSGVNKDSWILIMFVRLGEMCEFSEVTVQLQAQHAGQLSPLLNSCHHQVSPFDSMEIIAR